MVNVWIIAGVYDYLRRLVNSGIFLIRAILPHPGPLPLGEGESPPDVLK
jgi:hypothetical protein